MSQCVGGVCKPVTCWSVEIVRDSVLYCDWLVVVVVVVVIVLSGGGGYSGSGGGGWGGCFIGRGR